MKRVIIGLLLVLSSVFTIAQDKVKSYSFVTKNVCSTSLTDKEARECFDINGVVTFTPDSILFKAEDINFTVTSVGFIKQHEPTNNIVVQSFTGVMNYNGASKNILLSVAYSLEEKRFVGVAVSNDDTLITFKFSKPSETKLQN